MQNVWTTVDKPRHMLVDRQDLAICRYVIWLCVKEVNFNEIKLEVNFNEIKLLPSKTR